MKVRRIKFRSVASINPGDAKSNGYFLKETLIKSLSDFTLEVLSWREISISLKLRRLHMMMRRTTIPNSSFLIPNYKKSRTPKGMRLFAYSHKKGIPKGCSSCAFVSVSDNPSDHCCAASGLFRIQLTGILLRPFSTTKRILYKNGLVKEIYEGNIVTRDGGLVTGDWGLVAGD